MTFRKAALVLLVLGVAAPSFAADLTLFRERNFRGAKVQLSDSSASISFAPRALRIGNGAWQLCPRPFFGGQCIMVDADTADLRLPRGFSGTVQSARPVAAGAAVEAPAAAAPREPERPKAPPEPEKKPEQPKL